MASDMPAPPASRPPLQYRVRALQLVTIGLALGVWETAARAGWIDPLFVPAPGAVGAALGTIGGTALAALGDTLGKTAIAYVLSVTLGVAAGLTVGSVRLLREVLNPFVIALYSLPKILVLPWIVLLLGYGTAPAVLYGTIHGFFPVTVLVIGAVRDVDRTLVTVARAYGATTWQLYWKVLLPAIVPSVVAGMRLGVVFCLLGVLVVEMFAGVRGMGYVMSSLANGFQAPELFAATALVAELAVSRDVEIYGDDVTGQLAPPVADMEAELARRGCRAMSRAYWTDTTPLRTLHVEVRCKEGNDDDRVSLR